MSNDTILKMHKGSESSGSYAKFETPKTPQKTPNKF